MALKGEFYIATNIAEREEVYEEFLNSSTDEILLVVTNDVESVIEAFRFFYIRSTTIHKAIIMRGGTSRLLIHSRDNAQDDNRVKLIYVRSTVDNFARSLINEYKVKVAFFEPKTVV